MKRIDNLTAQMKMIFSLPEELLTDEMVAKYKLLEARWMELTNYNADNKWQQNTPFLN